MGVYHLCEIICIYEILNLANGNMDSAYNTSLNVRI